MSDNLDAHTIDKTAVLYDIDRRSTRELLSIQVRVTEAIGSPKSYLSRDASRYGLFIRTAQPLAPGTRVHLAFALPRTALVQVEGEVVWNTRDRLEVEPASGGMGVGGMGDGSGGDGSGGMGRGGGGGDGGGWEWGGWEWGGWDCASFAYREPLPRCSGNTFAEFAVSPSPSRDAPALRPNVCGRVSPARRMRPTPHIAAIVAIAAVAVTAPVTVRADDTSPARPRIERCLEQPMSLALAIAEHEASRSLSPQSLVSDDQPVLATPAPVARPAPNGASARSGSSRPFNSLPRACMSPDDPGCRVSSSTPARGAVRFDTSVHGFAIVPSDHIPPEPTSRSVPQPRTLALGGPREGHIRGTWRPPTEP